jgi:F-type H+-transporting ATPase subunit a
MIMYSPLEQFALITFVPFHICSLYFNFTNSSLFIILAVSLIVSLLSITINSRGRMIPTV